MKILSSALFNLCFNLCSCLFLALTLNSCQKPDAGSPPYKAKVVTTDENGYGLKTVTFQTLVNVDSVNGDLAVLKGNASLDVAAASSDVVSSDNPDDLYSHKGESVALDYEIKNGIIIPRNFDSVSMLTAYYHFEQIFLFWQKNLGLSLSDFGKTRIFIDPKVEIKQDGVTASGALKINAAFIPGPRDFWLFKTGSIEKIPLKMNLGVLAHEFTHSVFDLYFAEKSPSFYDLDSNPDQHKSFVLSAINEGLADYYSWVMTGKHDEFTKSLDVFAKQRTLPVSWTLKQYRENSDNLICQGSFYCEGSVLASALYEISNLDGNSAISTGRQVLTAITALREDWQAAKDGENFDHDKLINRIYSQLTTNTTESCQIFKKWFDVDTVLEKIECS